MVNQFWLNVIQGLVVMCLFGVLAFIVRLIRGKVDQEKFDEVYAFLIEKIDKHEEDDKIMSHLVASLPTKEYVEMQLKFRDELMKRTNERLESIEVKLDALPDKLEDKFTKWLNRNRS